MINGMCWGRGNAVAVTDLGLKVGNRKVLLGKDSLMLVTLPKVKRQMEQDHPAHGATQ